MTPTEIHARLYLLALAIAGGIAALALMVIGLTTLLR
jgi:hypothetical protein